MFGPLNVHYSQSARLCHAGKAPLLILSGGHDPQYSAVSSTESMRRFIGALGVPDSAMVLEERSRNTTQNVDFGLATDHEVKALLGGSGCRRLMHWMVVAGL